MAKRKSSVGKPLSFVAAVLGLVAVVMLFLPAIGIKDTDTTYTGLQITFGYQESLLGFEYTVFDFSFMNLLTYIRAGLWLCQRPHGVYRGGGVCGIGSFLLPVRFLHSAQRRRKQDYFVCRRRHQRRAYSCLRCDNRRRCLITCGCLQPR